MDPGADQDKDLPFAPKRPQREVGQEHHVVAMVERVGRIDPASGQVVVDEKRHDREAQSQPHTLAPAHAKPPSLIERPERERKMGEEGSIKRGAADGPVPDPFVKLQTPRHGLKRDVAKRVIREVKGEIGKHHPAASEPQPPNRILVAQPRVHAAHRARAIARQRRCLHRLQAHPER